MSVKYVGHIGRLETPQSEPIPGEQQIANAAGGYVYQIDKWARLERFLILGTDGGTYYASEKKLTRENATVVDACAAEDAARTVRTIVEISDAGRAAKNDPAILALAIVASSADTSTRALALAELPKVCRIPTHLFHFLAYCKAMRGWSRGLRRAVREWYARWDVDHLAFEVAKYQQRDGWSNRDAFRLSHLELPEPQQAVMRWAMGLPLGEREVAKKNANATFKYRAAGELPAILRAYDEIKALVEKDSATRATLDKVVEYITTYKLTREMLPSETLNSPLVWDALLDEMKPEAMIRNLGKMSAVELLKPMSTATSMVIATLKNRDALKKARIHPIFVLNAMRVYAKGQGDKGSLMWKPVQQIVDALDEAFYLCFDNVTPTNKRLMLAVDISGSMDSSYIAGTALSAREASAALALVTASVEPSYAIYGFDTNFAPIPISPRQRLDDVIRIMCRLHMGGTDCALPMIHAQKLGLEIDAFAVYTDNETWAGSIHPSQALRRYRQSSGIASKLAVVGMTATECSIADPNDRGMMDFVGFSTATPEALGTFIRE